MHHNSFSVALLSLITLLTPHALADPLVNETSYPCDDPQNALITLNTTTPVSRIFWPPVPPLTCYYFSSGGHPYGLLFTRIYPIIREPVPHSSEFANFIRSFASNLDDEIPGRTFTPTSARENFYEMETLTRFEIEINKRGFFMEKLPKSVVLDAFEELAKLYNMRMPADLDLLISRRRDRTAFYAVRTRLVWVGVGQNVGNETAKGLQVDNGQDLASF